MNQRRRFQGFVLLVFTLVCAGVFVLLLHIAGGTNLASKYTFDAVVPNAIQLVPGANVREAGVNVGTVRAISNRGDSAVIGIALNKKYAPVFRDGTVRVATKTLVGENYIDLNPGDKVAGAVPPNGVLPISQAQTAVQLDQILSTFTPARQARVRRLLAGLGGGLNGHAAQLNATLDALSGAVTDAGPVAQAISDQSQQLAAFTGDLGSVLNALAQRSTQIQQFVTAGTATARTVAARDAALRADLAALPPTISTVSSVGRHLAAVGASANPVLDNLGAALGDLTPALRNLPTAGAATVTALHRLAQVTPTASRLIDALRSFAPSLSTDVNPLAHVVNQLRPLVSYLGPYAKDMDAMLYDMDSVGLTSDANGILASLVPVESTSSIQNATPAQKQLIKALLGSGLAQMLGEAGVNNYPAPGTADTPQPLSTSYPVLKPDRGG
ncbi:MAG TPA: MlaD family protein [Solirubrobacteraceae bacterium]|nr:MlaD family protein [Solirubrobacteraceae bacterium]